MRPIKRQTINYNSRNCLIRFRGWQDYYTLGIFCGLSGLTRYVRSKIRDINKGDKSRLFEAGLTDSEGYTYKDISHEIRVLRSQDEGKFDILIFNVCGERVLSEILKQIKED